MFNQHANYKEMKMASSSGMSETTHHNGSHLLLLGKRKLQSFQKPLF